MSTTKCLKYLFNVLVIALFLLLPAYLPVLRHSVYIGLGASLVAVVTLLIWPYFAFNMHRTPLYVEDIEKTNDDNLIWWFKILLTLSTSAGLGLVVEFAWERFHNDQDIHLAEVLGVLGGLMTLFSKIHMIAGKVLLMIFGCLGKKGRVEIELNEEK